MNLYIHKPMCNLCDKLWPPVFWLLYIKYIYIYNYIYIYTHVYNIISKYKYVYMGLYNMVCKYIHIYIYTYINMKHTCPSLPIIAIIIHKKINTIAPVGTHRPSYWMHQGTGSALDETGRVWWFFLCMIIAMVGREGHVCFIVIYVYICTYTPCYTNIYTYIYIYI